MSDTVLNLLLAVFLLAANAFYVAAEFALVKTQGLPHRRARGGEPLRRDADPAACSGNIEAYLACCQLGITMASLGLGWVGEPTVAALARTGPRCRSACPRPAIHFTAFLVGFLVFSSLHIVVGEQVPKTLAIREPEPVSLWIAYPLHVSFSCSTRSTGCSTTPRARSCGCSASGKPRTRRSSPTSRSRASSRSRPSTARWRRARPSSSTTSSASASSRSPTSWSTGPTCTRSTSPSRPSKIIDDSAGEPLHARAGLGGRAGEHRRRRPRQGSAARHRRRPAAT